MSDLQMMKLALMTATGLSKDALHIYAGLAVFFGVAAVARVSLASPRPWLSVALVAVVVEIADMRDNIVTGVPSQFAGHWHDVWNTLFWPTVIMLLARFTSVLQRR